MATPAEQIVLIDAKLANCEQVDVNVPQDAHPNTNRIVVLMANSTRLLQKVELKRPQVRNLTRIRELLSRVA